LIGDLPAACWAAVNDWPAGASPPWAEVIGEVGGSDVRIELDGQELVDEPVAELESAWRETLAAALDRPNQIAAD